MLKVQIPRPLRSQYYRYGANISFKDDMLLHDAINLAKKDHPDRLEDQKHQVIAYFGNPIEARLPLIQHYFLYSYADSFEPFARIDDFLSMLQEAVDLPNAKNGSRIRLGTKKSVKLEEEDKIDIKQIKQLLNKAKKLKVSKDATFIVGCEVIKADFMYLRYMLALIHHLYAGHKDAYEALKIEQKRYSVAKDAKIWEGDIKDITGDEFSKVMAYCNLFPKDTDMQKIYSVACWPWRSGKIPLFFCSPRVDLAC